MRSEHAQNIPALPDVRSLRGAGCVPRVHPNGFIQIDLGPEQRLHVWHPRLEFRQKTYSPVHDHIFAFDSFVYSGRLVNVAYLKHEPISVEPTHESWTAVTLGGSETILARAEGPAVALVASYIEVVQPGQAYFMPSYMLHESLANEPTMTIIRKRPFEGMHTGANCDGATVMVRRGEKPDNDFRREAFDTEVLWNLIEEAHPWSRG